MQEKYGALPPGEPTRHHGPTEEGVSGFRYREWTGDILQTQLAFGWRTPGTTHPDTPSLDLLAAVLGSGRASRFYRAVRERRLASSISAYNYTPTDIGVFVVHAETPPASAADAARAIWDQLRAVRDGDLGELEIERAKRIYESQFVRRLEDMEGQANYLAEWEAMGDWRMGERLSRAPAHGDARRSRRRRQPLPRSGQRRHRRLSARRRAPAIAESPAAMREFLDARRVRRRSRRRRRTRRTRCRPRQTPVFEREEAGVRVYRTAQRRSDRDPAQARRAAAARRRVHARRRERRGAGAGRAHDADGAHGAQGHDARARALQIAEEGEMLGGSVGAAAGSESFGWSMSVPTRYAAGGDRAACRRRRSIRRSNEDALETERAIAISDVRGAARRHVSLSDAPRDAGGVRRTSIRYSGERHRGDRCARIDAARDSAVARRPGAAVAVGDRASSATGIRTSWRRLRRAPSTTLRHVDAALPPAPAWPTMLTTSVESRDRAQTALAMLFPGPARRDDARYSAAMIASVASGLGGRFFDELRDKRSLCYTVHAFASERRLAGTFGAYIATGPEQESCGARRTARRVPPPSRGTGDGRGAGARAAVRDRRRTPSGSRAAARCWAISSTPICSAP